MTFFLSEWSDLVKNLMKLVDTTEGPHLIIMNKLSLK
jgi:hypothetical protein